MYVNYSHALYLWVDLQILVDIALHYSSLRIASRVLSYVRLKLQGSYCNGSVVYAHPDGLWPLCRLFQ